MKQYKSFNNYINLLNLNAIVLLITGVHEQSLNKVFGMEKGKKSQSNSHSKTAITVALAEHLLGKLAPEQSFVINDDSKNKENCKCGCDVAPNYGSTGIGMCIRVIQSLPL